MRLLSLSLLLPPSPPREPLDRAIFNRRCITGYGVNGNTGWPLMIYYDKPLITAARIGIDTLLCRACKLSRSRMRPAFLAQIAEAEARDFPS